MPCIFLPALLFILSFFSALNGREWEFELYIESYRLIAACCPIEAELGSASNPKSRPKKKKESGGKNERHVLLDNWVCIGHILSEQSSWNHSHGGYSYTNLCIF